MSRGHFDHHGLRWALGGGGYQFYTTSPTVQWAIWNDSYDFCPGGSLIYAMTPEITHYSTDADIANAKIIAKPLLTTVELAPRIVEGASERPECKKMSTPSHVRDNGSVIGLGQIMNQIGFKIKESWQIQGIGEPVSYISYPEMIENNTVATGYHKELTKPIFNAWLQTGGTIANYNLQGFSFNSGQVDVGFDMSPGKLPKGIQQVPDSDWHDRAIIRHVAQREFMIVHASNDEWLCWPVLGSANLDYKISVTASPELRAQGYKANVPEKYTKRVFPEYPAWVCAPKERLSERDNPLKMSARPRYTFTFTSDGTKAVAAMIERKPLLAGCTKAWKTEFLEPETGVGLQKSSWRLNTYIDATNPLLHAQIESETATELLIDGTLKASGDAEAEGPQPFCHDRAGIVILDFSIEVTGDNLEDFNFSVSVSNDSRSPDDLEELEVGTLIDAAFAKPMVAYPSAVNAKFSTVVDGEKVWTRRKAQVTERRPESDDLVTAFLTLYQTKEQEKFSKGYYQYSRRSVSKAKVSFYRKKEYETKNPILELPLHQSYGTGYYNQDIDPETLPIERLKPHALVDLLYDSRHQWNRPADDPRDPIYLYSAKITSLDLSTLSFIYSITINEVTTDTVSLIGNYYKQFNEQTEMCNVYIYGYLADESFVGIQGKHIDYLKGFADSVHKNSEWVTANELVIPQNFDNLDIKYDYSEHYTGTGVWWLSGMCGCCIYLTLLCASRDTLMFVGDNKLQVIETPFPYSRSALTEDDGKDYLRFAIENVGDLIAGITTLTAYRNFVIPTVGDPYLDDPYQSAYLENNTNCPSGINPFYLARDSFDAEEFIERCGWFMKELATLFFEFESTKDGCYGFDTSFNLATTLMTNGLTEVQFYSEQGLNLFDLEPVENIVRIKNYDWGKHLYNQYREKCFSSESLTEAYASIVTSIEGHYSYYYKGHYNINKKYTAIAYNFMDHYGSKSDGNGGIIQASLLKKYNITGYSLTAPDDLGRSFELRVFNDENLDADSFEWKLVEGVGWYCGKIKVSHLDYYNMAFSEEWRKAKRLEGRNPPYALPNELPIALHNELPIALKYSAESFRPEFNIKLSWVGEPLYSPSPSGDNIERSLQMEAYKYDSFYNESYYEYPGRQEGFEVRPFKKHLRLSPLFFS